MLDAGGWREGSGAKEAMGRVFHVGRGISDRLAGKGLRIDEVKVQETWFSCVLGFCSVVPLYGVMKMEWRR